MRLCDGNRSFVRFWDLSLEAPFLSPSAFALWSLWDCDLDLGVVLEFRWFDCCSHRTVLFSASMPNRTYPRVPPYFLFNI